MMIHRHFEEKVSVEELKPEAVQETAAEKVEEGADIVPEPVEIPAEKPASTRGRRKR